MCANRWWRVRRRPRSKAALPDARRVLGGACLLVLTWGMVRPAFADPLLRLRRDGGEVGGSIESLSSRDAISSQSEAPRTQLWLRLPLDGAFVSPRLFAWSGSVRPSLQRGPAGGGGTVKVTDTGYEFSARAFTGSPFTLGAVAARSRGTSRASGVTLSEFRSDVSSLTAQLRLRGIAVQGELGDRRSDQSWVVGPLATAVEQDIRVKQWRLEASNSKLQAWRQRDLRVGPSTDEYLTYASGITHGLRWGHGSELSSRYTRDEQSRPTRTGQWDWNERVRLRHGARTETAWSREERHAWNPSGEARALGWSSRASHTPNSWLRLGAGYQERRASAPGERSVTRSGGPEVSVGGRLAGAVRADLTAGYDRETRSLSGELRGPVDVLDERALFDASGSVLLLRAGVRAATFRVESPDHTVTFLENVDYRVIVNGSTFQVLVLPGGRLRPGDAVLLSYTYDPPTAGAADADLVRLNATLGWKSLTARHARRRRDADGSGIAVTARTSAYDEDESTLEYDRTARMGRLRVAGGLTHRTFDGVRQRVTDVRGEYTTAPTRYGQPSFAAGWSRRTGDAAPLDLDDVSAGWTAMPINGLTTIARFELRRSRFDSHPLERTTGVTLDADWRFGALESQLRYGFAARRDGVDRDAQRVWLRVTRRF